MRLKRAVLGSTIAAISLAGSMFLASPASAAKPVAGCPTSYSGPTAISSLPGYAQAGAGPVDKNADGNICWKPLPTNKNDPNPALGVVDNTSSQG